MIHADPVRGQVGVIQADVADQRFPAFVFTPGADDLHRFNAEAKLMPNVGSQIPLKVTSCIHGHCRLVRAMRKSFCTILQSHAAEHMEAMTYSDG